MAAAHGDRPWRVFLSHTSELRRYPTSRSFVAAAADAVTRVGDAVIDMAYFEARDDAPAAVCSEKVNQADAVAVIVGFRYGSPVRDDPSRSYVELEVAAAVEAALPRLVFLLDEDVEGPRALTHDSEFGDRQEAFRDRLRATGGLVVTVTSPDDLAAKLGHALTELHRRHAAQAGTHSAAAERTRALVDRLDTAAALPPLSRIFADRVVEIDRVLTVLRAEGPAGAVCVISGMPGVGKTALALQAAKRSSGAYPDGVLYVDLRGYTTGTLPERPADALDRLLRKLGVDGAAIPRGLDDRAALFRAQLADLRVLVVLDNARDVEQVRPLLPGRGRCGVLVTSRAALLSLDEAQPVRLDLLPDEHGVELFRSVAGPGLPGTADSTEAVRQIVAACAGLPLAIRIAAARWRSLSNEPITAFSAQLSDEKDRLSELDDGDRSVSAALRMSFASLTAPVRQLFGLLGVHPGTEFDELAVSAVAGISIHEARAALTGLTSRSLVERRADRRFRLHDLVAAFLRADPEILALVAPIRSAARHRLADYYLYVAELADRTITPHRHRIRLDIASAPDRVPDVSHVDTAMEWLSTHESTLVDVCRTTATGGLDAHCWQLAYTLRGYYFLTKRWQPWRDTFELALAAARRAADRGGEGQIENGLGLLAIELGDTNLATTHYRAALEIFRDTGDEHGEHTASANLAWIAFEEGRHHDFVDLLRTAHAFYERVGSVRNAAITLRGIALGEGELGRTTDAVRHLHEVLPVFADLGLELDLAMAFNALGEVLARSAEITRAREAFESGLAASTRCGSRFEQARAHRGLGDLAEAGADRETAAEHWARALDGYHALDAPQAAELRRRLMGGRPAVE